MPLYHYYIFHSTGPHIATIQAESDADLQLKLQAAARGYMYLRIYTDYPDSTWPHIDTCDIPHEIRARTMPEKNIDKPFSFS